MEVIRPTQKEEQKKTEIRIFEAARRVCSLFPPGDIEAFEEPDLRIKTGDGGLYVEVTELPRPKDGNLFVPVQAENFHKVVVRLAEKYYRNLGAAPASVTVYFLDELRWQQEDPAGLRRLTESGRKQEKMSESLAEFVRDRYVPGDGPVTFSRRRDLPTGFSVIGIAAPTGSPWFAGESGAPSLLNREQLMRKIKEKNELLPTYRVNAPNSPIWLLIISGPSIARGIPLPYDVEEWKFEFDFEKVLFFSGMDNRVIEIRRVARA